MVDSGGGSVPQFDKHTPSGASIRADGKHVSQTSKEFESLKEDIEARHKNAKQNVDGDPRDAMDGATRRANEQATKLYNRARVAGAAIIGYGRAVDIFNTKIEHWNTELRNIGDEKKRGDRYRELKKSYSTAVEMLEEAAHTAKSQLKNWDDEKTINQLRQSGALPSSVHAESDGSNSYGELDDKIKEEWASLSDKERRSVLDNLAQELAEKYGIDVPPVDFDDDMDKNSLGRWDPGSWVPFDNDSLHVNPDHLDNPESILDTVAHEVRHAAQHQWADGADEGFWWFQDDSWDETQHPSDITKDDAQEFGDNFDDYIDPPETDDWDERPDEAQNQFDEYKHQPVEADASEAGGRYVDRMTMRDLERLKE